MLSLQWLSCGLVKNYICIMYACIEITSCISSWNNTTSSLGRLQKKSLEHNDCLYVPSVCIETECVKKPQTDNVPSPQNYFQTNCQSAMLHISSKNTSGWVLLMRQHSNFSLPQRNFLYQKLFSAYWSITTAHIEEHIFCAAKIFLFACLHVFTSWTQIFIWKC